MICIAIDLLYQWQGRKLERSVLLVGIRSVERIEVEQIVVFENSDESNWLREISWVP